MVDRGASGETELNGWWVPDCARLAGAPLPEDGGVLRVCLDLAGVERPRTFEAPSGTRQVLITYRRAAPVCCGIETEAARSGWRELAG